MSSDCELKVGDRVVRDPLHWIPNQFDSWGRGLGIGEVVQAPFKLHEDELDVRWPRGRCFEYSLQVVRAPTERSEIQNEHGVLGFFVDLSLAESKDSVILSFNRGMIGLVDGHWNGNLDAFNDYIAWPQRDSYTLVIYGWPDRFEGDGEWLRQVREIIEKSQWPDTHWRDS